MNDSMIYVQLEYNASIRIDNSMWLWYIRVVMTTLA